MKFTAVLPVARLILHMFSLKRIVNGEKKEKSFKKQVENNSQTTTLIPPLQWEKIGKEKEMSTLFPISSPPTSDFPYTLSLPSLYIALQIQIVFKCFPSHFLVIFV